tara:strand:- start:7107 stop:7406 length:300 start_codon:yes stop_codon:yes gene_type:complete
MAGRSQNRPRQNQCWFCHRPLLLGSVLTRQYDEIERFLWRRMFAGASNVFGPKNGPQTHLSFDPPKVWSQGKAGPQAPGAIVCRDEGIANQSLIADTVR